MCGRLTLLDRRPGRLERRHGLADARLDARLHAGHEVLAGQAQPLARARWPQPRRPTPAGAASVGRDRHRRGGRIALVAAGDRVEQRGRVARVAGERPDLVERAGERDDPVAADPPVRRLHARRSRHSAAGWRMEPPVSVPIDERRVEGRDGRRRAAAAAARDAVERPRVGRRPERRVLGRRAHRELVHVGLAEDHGPGVAEPLRDVRVVRR